MSRTPPREGARWGEDHEPASNSNNPYERACIRFGKENVDLALNVFEHIKLQFPYLKIFQSDRSEFVIDLLSQVESQVKYAAEDGRIHSMPETINIMKEHLGGFLAQNPEITRMPTIKLEYGDEHTGYAAQKQNQKMHEENVKKLKAEKINRLMWYYGYPCIFGGVTYVKSESVLYGIIVAFVSGLITEFIYDKFIKR